jgi:hypothetical protein
MKYIKLIAYIPNMLDYKGYPSPLARLSAPLTPIFVSSRGPYLLLREED